jgi:aspartate aminotransferase, cytoplasmic
MLIETDSPDLTLRTSKGFVNLPDVAVDEIFALQHAYQNDVNSNKVNLGIGVYRTDEGDPWVLPTVRKVENQLHLEDDQFRHEYLAIEGDKRFLNLARDLVFGLGHGDKATASTAGPEAKNRISSVQTISGTGANHVGAAFLAQHLKPKHVWISNPSWGNHQTIWNLQGISRKPYPYYDAATRSFDFTGAMQVLEAEAEDGDVVILHGCAHNPTGLDPSKQQWKAIADLCHRKGLFPFFDLAYQGFVSGSVDEDAWAVRYFFNYQPQLPMCVAQSFSKNFGLYGQRVGALHLVTNIEVTQELVKKNLALIIRSEYSMAPRGGSTIVTRVLSDPNLRAEWGQDLIVMSSRIKRMRQALYDELIRLETPGSWEHIINQVSFMHKDRLRVCERLSANNLLLPFTPKK